MAKKNKEAKAEKTVEVDASTYTPFVQPSFVTRLLTLGHALGAILGFAVVYFVWGMLFKPGGTGSNVVLALLVAVFAVYLISTHFGPILDGLLARKSADEAARENAHDYLASILAESSRFIAKKSKKSGSESDELKALKIKAITSEDALNDEKTSAKSLLDMGVALEKTMTMAGFKRPGPLAQMRSLGSAFLVALALRAFIAEPFQIPSGSMLPTLEIGDHLFVARYQYGMPIPLMKKYLIRWSTPEPGDVVVFTSPEWVPLNAGEAWIKRVIAGPGQRVRMKDTVVYVDDKPYSQVGKSENKKHKDFSGGSWHYSTAIHEREVIEGKEHSIYKSALSTNIHFPNFSTGNNLTGLECNKVECKVKEGFIFVMGDNRDNSNDGRSWGAVPIEHVKGKAAFIWISVDGSEETLSLGRFVLPGFRWNRTFDAVE